MELEYISISILFGFHYKLNLFIIYSWERNTKIKIQLILSYRGSFPSYLIHTVKLRVRILSITNTAALCCGYRALLIFSPQRYQNSRNFIGFSTVKT